MTISTWLHRKEAAKAGTKNKAILGLKHTPCIDINVVLSNHVICNCGILLFSFEQYTICMIILVAILSYHGTNVK